MNHFRKLTFATSLVALLLFAVSAFAQETTAGLQGTVKDQSGAVVSGATITVTGDTLVGDKTLKSDASGYYHFSNLPPGTYTIKVTAEGFATYKNQGVVLEVGHLPTLDIGLQVGKTETVVEVSGEAPVIDVTTNHTLTNVTEDVIQNVPHGYSFQSAIQLAPGARNEPLAGGNVGMNSAGGTGTGGQSPGNGSNGGGFGYSIGGGADSENSYLVEGQETADAIGGFSHTNVPFPFIQEMQVKSTGIEAEYGGALGGVVNVIMNKGGNNYHGSVFSQFERSSWDGSPNGWLRYDPNYTSVNNPNSDATGQYYQPKKDKVGDVFPGFTFGGPLLPRLKNKLWFFAAFNPEFHTQERIVDWNFPGNPAFPAQVGLTPFSRNTQTYYANGRIDAALTQKIRVFASWLYEYQRQSGEAMPPADSVTGQTNPANGAPYAVYGHNLGFTAPNSTTNLGLDYTLTSHLVATFRWGYNFQNYRDFGYPTGSFFDTFAATGVGATDNLGNPISPTSQLSQLSGFFSAPNNQNTTTRNRTLHNQINGNVAWYKSGWGGTHNFKFGYQLNRLSNSINQHFNEPAVLVYPGAGNAIPDNTSAWSTNCAPFIALYGVCAGQYGYINIQDFGSSGNATSMNHSLFVQDSWTLARGLTINAGIRVEHEYLPAENQPAGGISIPIKFGWGTKIGPRIGMAWDPTKDGKWKIFGSYGKFYDTMKLNLAISSFGGQYWNNCYYALDTQNLSSIAPAFDSNGRYCPAQLGSPNADQVPAEFAGGTTPPGITFIQNQNNRAFPTTCSTCTATGEGVAPGLKPYSQHEAVFGIDRQITRNVAFEARWDRRRLDYAIEDSALFDPAVGETFVIVNPGKGVNKTFDGFWNFLYGSPSGCATTNTCPPNNVAAARAYDGVEFRVTKTGGGNWAGMFAYTYSHFRGNYSGLTNTDISDGGGGRNSPNNSRAFDEPFMSYSANGTPDNGPLATDRPNTFKAYAYYTLPWMRKKMHTNIGLFQYLYQGSPVSTFTDIGVSSPNPPAFSAPAAQGGAFNQYVEGWGKFVPVSQDPVTGAITVGTPYARRTPWFIQSDLTLSQTYKIAEGKELSFSVTSPNVFNRHSVTSYWGSLDSTNYPQWIGPSSAACQADTAAAFGISPVSAAPSQCWLLDGADFYNAVERPWDWKGALTQPQGTVGQTPSNQLVINSLYGKPLYHQQARSLFMSVKFTF